MKQYFGLGVGLLAGTFIGAEEPEVPMQNQSPQLKAHRLSVLLYNNGKASKQ